MELKIEQRPVESLIPYARNARTHSPEQVRQIAASILEFGFVNPVLISDSERGGVPSIIAGHGRVLAARQAGLAAVPCICLGHLSETQRRAFILADNRLALSAGWDEEMLANELKALDASGFDLALIGFDDDELKRALASDSSGPAGADDNPKVGDGVGLREKWGVEAGQMWALGDHLLFCGDSTNQESVTRMLGVDGCDLLMTDPPYCSGGFQESGRHSGSIGTDARDENGRRPRIHNDALSSRGYCALMKSVLIAWKPSFAYMFTDWRMWVQLFDVMESSGFGVRNMVVWDKGSPGMGVGWRTQHELVMFGASAVPKFDNHKAVGNVISAQRTGNPDHPTQKPVELISKMLDVTDFCQTIGDPFSGSGTTLIACEQLGRRCRAMEISPEFVAVTLQRWSEATGKIPEKVE